MFFKNPKRPMLALTLALNILLFHTPSSQANELLNSTLIPETLASTSNITILHEVHEEGFSTKKDKPLNPEVLPLKPVKKKPYTPLEKSSSIYEKSKPVKDLDLHPVIFDFNLGDLEDLEHEAYKKKDLSNEEKLLLKDAPTIADVSTLTYSEIIKTPDSDSLQDDLNVQVDFVASTMESAIKSSSPSSISSTTAILTPSTLPSSYVVTVSPHIFKIMKSKSIKKGRELLKHEDLHKGLNNHNSLDHYLTPPDTTEHNATAESRQMANVFQILTNLYDHFYWQPSDIRNKVSTGCGLELQAYLTALHGNYHWAQRAYDSSGRYRGQLFFGNDKWLGQKQNCYELNRQLDPEKRKHFEFEFYTAVVTFNLALPELLQFNLQIGECLPKSCTALDVQHILEMDPHAQMLIALNSSQLAQVKILRVRTVPGIYSYWRELRFQIFASFLLTLILLVIAATWFQSKLTQSQINQAPIAVISGSKIEQPVIHHITSDNGKTFELYQMSNLNENNNVVEMETEVNGKKSSSSQTQYNMPQDMNTNGNGCSSHAQDVEYRIETTNNAAAGGTYETKQPLGLHEQLLLCFAFQTNASTILSIDQQKETQTSCVHGLRVISVLWTIMVHTYLQMFNIGENRFRRIMVERSPWYQIVGNATFSVDTFFFISGFLVTLLYLKSMKKDAEDSTKYMKKGFVDTVILVVYRYIRLTPAYLFVIFFNDFALRQTFDGSVFQPTVLPNTCSKYWWRNILYINNFYPLTEICMIWSWYMANDMQFYIMATLLLILSARYFKTMVLTICTFLVSSWGVSGLISLRYHYTHKVAKPFESFDFLYDKPWQRVGPYIMGMLAGYIIFKVRSPPKISQRVNNLLWVLSLGLIIVIIFGVWQGELNEVTTAFYVSIGHTAFGFGLIWVVLSCCWNLSPTMNRILSYRCLWPLSRLTYCTYLIHPVIMLITAYRMDGTIHLSNVFILIIFLGNAVVSFIVAFFISVVFEAPVIRLLKIIFRK
ncbi:uncharacterized protein LOC119613920 [Lucilia sericata]|uniref:uncharacterized protein LOC119613920 n=1 Tax=Lucilia sericata TaxID=13632 RepID=UPI0018A82B9F|nr:uncharacterized protein LOC119613920 [Lucilia sericata]